MNCESQLCMLVGFICETYLQKAAFSFNLHLNFDLPFFLFYWVFIVRVYLCLMGTGGLG